MVNVDLKKLGLPAALILFLLPLFTSQAFSEAKFARVNAQASDIAEGHRAGIVEESALPEWLDELLSRIPEGDKSEALQEDNQELPQSLAVNSEVTSESLERELEESIAPTPTQIAAPDPNHPKLPKTPHKTPHYTTPKNEREGKRTE